MSDQIKCSVIQLELSELKERVLHALMIRGEELERIVREQLDVVCTEEWITAIVENQIRITMEKCIRESIDTYAVRGAMAALIEQGLKGKLEHEKSDP